MVAIPIISGIATRNADFTTAFPVNLVPVPKATGISEGYLRPAPGIVTIADGGGANRGGYRWNDTHYRVMGSTFVQVSQAGVVTSIGTIAGADWVTFAESFDHLAINGGGKLYLYDGVTLAEVTDVDLGASLDVVWLNGYFISTDGEFLISSDINDPFSFNILRYQSSEISPDPVVSLQEIRNEIYAVNRYTVEIFAALVDPGAGFPFGRIEGAQIMRGAVGSRACCKFMAGLAFLGSGRNEPPSVWLGASGSSIKLSVREIDDALQGYSDSQLSMAVLESRMARGHEFLYIHLPDKTLVYDGVGSATAQQPMWFVLQSGNGGYRARGMVWCYGQWNVADPFGTLIGKLDENIGSHYGELTPWEFATPIVYNEGRGVQVHELELVAISGSVDLGNDPLIGTSYSTDGRTWTQTRYIRAGRQGERNRRLVWDRQGELRNWRTQRFSGDSRAHLAFARLEARVEALNV
jgi:Phage stabilisation protein